MFLICKIEYAVFRQRHGLARITARGVELKMGDVPCLAWH